MDKKEKLYFMGIAGTGMASVAGLLKVAGYKICGSDNGVYPPMSTMLEKLNIPILTPYSKTNLENEKPDVVVVANCLSRGNEEIEYMLQNKFRYTSFPELLGQTFLKKAHSVVVSGTHGKTTTTSLLSHFLTELQEDPSFLIGGIPRNFSNSFQLGKGELFVIEGDEYDTAFFDKESKFLHYYPKTLILNNIEFDHADIFAGIEQIEEAFGKLIDLVPQKNNIIANIDDPGVYKLLSQLNLLEDVTKISTRGKSRGGLVLEKLNYIKDIRKWELCVKSVQWGDMKIYTSMGGYHNASNIMMALGCLSQLYQSGMINTRLTEHSINDFLSNFKGVSRRFDHLCSNNGIEVYEDFAHHPTAVKNVIEGFRIAHPDRRLIVAFEPKNATSRRNIFVKQYAEVFNFADLALIGACQNDQRIPTNKQMNTIEMTNMIGKKSKAFSTNEDLCTWLLENSKKGDSIIFMSSGSFSGVARTFCHELATL